MKQHELKVYEDGWTKVPYCINCAAEGLMLSEECPGKIIIMHGDLYLTEDGNRISRKN